MSQSPLLMCWAKT